MVSTVFPASLPWANHLQALTKPSSISSPSPEASHPSFLLRWGWVRARRNLGQPTDLGLGPRPSSLGCSGQNTGPGARNCVPGWALPLTLRLFLCEMRTRTPYCCLISRAVKGAMRAGDALRMSMSQARPCGWARTLAGSLPCWQPPLLAYTGSST